MKKFTCIVIAFAAAFAVFASSCSSGMKGGNYFPDFALEEEGGNYDYDAVLEQPFTETAENPSAYFTLDRNTANYSLVRRQIMQYGELPAPDSVRAEEIINYFDYDYPAPAEGEAISLTPYLFPCPWNEKHLLLDLGIRTKEVKINASAANYVFLIDVSGSMAGNDRIGLIKKAISYLVPSLGEKDAISIVTYANGVNTLLLPTAADEAGKEKILSAVNALEAGGSTYGSGGIEQAYSLARENFQEGGNNRVILMSDGDFNVGISDPDRLSSIIREKAAGGIYLTVLGFGMGNTRDSVLETLARNGNGNYAYIDNENEARKVFEKDIAGMLFTVAKDAKAGITFNADIVAKYRPIGYDTKLITEEQFENPDTDAGEIGSNLCVSALYEIELTEGAEANSLLARAEIRYKDVSAGNADTSVSADVSNAFLETDDTKFIACAAEFALLLRNSEYKGNASWENLLSRLSAIESGFSADPIKAEFFGIARTAADLGGET